MSNQSHMFVRNATGLVRELTAFDAFNLVFAAILIPVGISQALNFGAAAFPGANVALAFILGATLLLIGFGAVYIYFTMAMPRSGGDYVWVSRTLSPFLGFVVNVTLTFVFVNWVSFNFTTMMTLFGPAAGYVMDWSPNVIQWFNVPANQFIVATILTILFTFLMIPGTKFVAKFMRILFIVVWAGMALWFIGLLVTPNDVFVKNFIEITKTNPTQIIELAKNSGFSVPTGLNWGMTILAMLWAFQNLTGFQWSGYFAGELKNVRRTVVISVLGGLIVGAILYAAGSFLVYRTVGFELFSSLSYIGINAPDKMPSNVTYILPSLTKFFALPTIIKDLIALTFMLSIIWWTPAGFMLGTRNLFAWAFDNLAPSWVADVHSTFHTPVNATIIMGIFIEILNFLNIYGGLSNYLINIIAVMALAFVVVGLAAVIFPYKRKDLYDNSPEVVRSKIGGIPVMTIAGLITMLSWSFVLIAAFSTSQFGLSVTPIAMIEAFSVPILASIWYFVATSIRKRQGIDISKVFSEIPPE
ncbi:MAG TPA: APC family permease [Thermoanaerobacter sp.]|nr:APC family permease [Thermoanaerobacter sp.]